MKDLLLRSRVIVLAHLSVIVLLLAAGAVSPGFLTGSSLRSMLVLATFIGIASLGQTFVVIGGGIDLSIPWVLTTAASPQASENAATRTPSIRESSERANLSTSMAMSMRC